MALRSIALSIFLLRVVSSLPNGIVVKKEPPLSQPDASTAAGLASKLVSHEALGNTAILQSFALRGPPVAILATLCVISVLYWRKGVRVVLKILIFLGALTTMKGAVKIVENTQSFKFPLFLTATHFACSSVVAFAVLFYNSVTSHKPVTIPSLRGFITMFMPIALAFAVSVVMCNIALLYSTTAFVEIISAASPITSVGIVVLMKKPFQQELLGPCMLVFLGCTFCSKSDPTFSFVGLLLAGLANVPRSLKGVLQQVLMQNESNETMFSPLEVVAWTCLPSTLIMFSWSFLHEGFEPSIVLLRQRNNFQLWSAILVSCANACVLNTANLFVIKDLGAVGSQLVAQTKSLLVVLGGVSVLGERVPPLEFLGFFLVMFGVYAYNDLESRCKAKAVEEATNIDERQRLLASNKQVSDEKVKKKRRDSW